MKAVSVGALAMITLGFTAPVHAASPQQSDTRATFQSGNATSCADIGQPGSTYSSGASIGSGSAEMFTWSATSAGTNPPTTPTLANGGKWRADSGIVNLTDISSEITITGIVVKGGPGYQVYSGAVENMIAPLNPGGNAPALSHWFVCYTTNPPADIPEIPVVPLLAISGAALGWLVLRPRRSAAA